MFPTETTTSNLTLTVYYPPSSTLWAATCTTCNVAPILTNTASNDDFATAQIQPELLYLTITPSAPPAVVNIASMVSVLGVDHPAGQTGIQAYHGSSLDGGYNMGNIVEASSAAYTVTAGVTLFIPYTANLDLTAYLAPSFSVLSNVSQTPLTTTTSDSITTTTTSGNTISNTGTMITTTTTPIVSVISPSISPQAKPSNHTGAIVGGVVGGVVAFALVIGVIFVIWQRRRRFLRKAEAIPYLSHKEMVRKG